MTTNNFNPRPRAEGGSKTLILSVYSTNFNPRPRAEGGPEDMATLRNRDISIHALVQRAATSKAKRVTHPPISIHALVQRAAE